MSSSITRRGRWAGVLIPLVLALLVPDVASAMGRPPTVWDPLPFPPHRKLEMARYSQRHYGIRAWRLIDPRVIVEHFTGSNNINSTINYFSSDQPHLGELPNVCTQFVIDTDGTVHQLVNLMTRCRHTIGLNYTAIGIEHVGTSDLQILQRPRQLHASLQLTAWLMDRYGISIGNVIGHNESLTSPYYRERAASYRCRTHGDWSHAHMVIYRRKLRRVAIANGVALGTGYWPVDNGC